MFVVIITSDFTPTATKCYHILIRRLCQNGKSLCNHPKQAGIFVAFLSANFATKNAMFNLNENNRIVMSQHPCDIRIGVDGMCGQVRSVGLDPTNGDVYSFVGKIRVVF